MLTMAGDGAGIAYAGRNVGIRFGRWWGVAGEAGEKDLSEGTEGLRTCIESLENVSNPVSAISRYHRRKGELRAHQLRAVTDC